MKNKLTIATIAIAILAYIFLVISVISTANKQVGQYLGVERMIRYEEGK
jgi:hypothetical protein